MMCVVDLAQRMLECPGCLHAVRAALSRPLCRRTSILWNVPALPPRDAQPRLEINIQYFSIRALLRESAPVRNLL